MPKCTDESAEFGRVGRRVVEAAFDGGDIVSDGGVLINLRRLALQGIELAQACTATIRTKLLKIGAAILRNTRRVRVLLASAHPMKHVLITAAHAR